MKKTDLNANFGKTVLFEEKKVQCKFCGKVFTVHPTGTNYRKICSEECERQYKNAYNRAYEANRKEKRKASKCCPVCNKELDSNSRGKYCSDECRKMKKRESNRLTARKNRTNWGCKLEPNITNCTNCPFKDCISSAPATQEESQMINEMIRLYTSGRTIYNREVNNNG